MGDSGHITFNEKAVTEHSCRRCRAVGGEEVQGSVFQSARTEYACLAMIELAVRYGDSKPSRLADLADPHHIPQRFLVQIFLQLKGNGLVTSIRGATGGYQLTRRPADITLADILAAVEPADPPEERISTPSAGRLHSVWKRLSHAREKILTETTLADLVPNAGGGDYVI